MTILTTVPKNPNFRALVCMCRYTFASGMHSICHNTCWEGTKHARHVGYCEKLIPYIGCKNSILKAIFSMYWVQSLGKNKDSEVRYKLFWHRHPHTQLSWRAWHDPWNLCYLRFLNIALLTPPIGLKLATLAQLTLLGEWLMEVTGGGYLFKPIAQASLKRWWR